MRPVEVVCVIMPRTARASVGGICYHVINRGNGRACVFHDERDYRVFVALMCQASQRIPVRMSAWCLMPNHFHFVLWPAGDGDMGRWMHWLLTSHVRRYHKRYGTDGHVWQGRFKAFPIEQDHHLLTVMRYVERNPLRANLVERAERWRWSSLHDLERNVTVIPLESPISRTSEWLTEVNAPQSHAEETALRSSIRRSRPYGGKNWMVKTAKALGLESSLDRRESRSNETNT